MLIPNTQEDTKGLEDVVEAALVSQKKNKKWFNLKTALAQKEKY